MADSSFSIDQQRKILDSLCKIQGARLRGNHQIGKMKIQNGYPLNGWFFLFYWPAKKNYRISFTKRKGHDCGESSKSVQWKSKMNTSKDEISLLWLTNRENFLDLFLKKQGARLRGNQQIGTMKIQNAHIQRSNLASLINQQRRTSWISATKSKGYNCGETSKSVKWKSKMNISKDEISLLWLTSIEELPGSLP